MTDELQESTVEVTPADIARANEAWACACDARDLEIFFARHRLASLPALPEQEPDAPTCANCKGILGDLAEGRDPEELCDTCYDDVMKTLPQHAPSPTDQAKLIEEMENLCAAMEYWAGLNEGCDTDTAVSEIMSSGGAWPSVAYSSARDLITRARNGSDRNG